MNGTVLIVLAAVAIGMWWFIARPQKRRQQTLQQAIQAAGPGTEIVTVGGIYGTVIENDPEETSIIIEIAEGVEMRIARKAIANVVPPHESPSADADEADSDEVDEVAEGEVVDEAEHDEHTRTGSAG
jgi:preprotein translocase subunit YajC